MGLELATYNITFEWISGAHNKAADYLSCIVGLPHYIPVSIDNMLSVYTHRWMSLPKMQYQTVKFTNAYPSDTSTSQPEITPEVSKFQQDPNSPKSLTARTGSLQALLQMQKTDPFCKRISKHLFNGKGPQHETDLFTHLRGLNCM